MQAEKRISMQKNELKQHLNNSLLFEVKYLGPTNFLGSRVKITTHDLAHRHNERPKSKILSYDYNFNSSADIAQFWLESKGFEIIAKNTTQKTDFFVCKWSFEQLCKAFDLKIED